MGASEFCAVLSVKEAQTKVLYRTLGLRSDAPYTEQGRGTMDELHLEELSVRVTQEKMDDAFRAAMQKAIDAGEEKTPTVVSKKPGTRNQKSTLAA